jgi:quinoprotein glucose dehydrogenase
VAIAHTLSLAKRLIGGCGSIALRPMIIARLLLCLFPIAVSGADTEWPINGGPYNIRYTELEQIAPSNVGQLQVAWTWDAHEAFKDSEMQSNPIVVDGVLYATTPKMHVVALDAQTGREVWNFDASRGETAQRRFRQRGVTVYKDRLFVTYRYLLWAIDRKTGKPIQKFGDDGHIDLRKGLEAVRNPQRQRV